MADNAWWSMAKSLGIGRDGAAAADVIHVPMRVDERIDWLFRPAPESLGDSDTAESTARVETHKTGVGRERNHMGERLDDCNAVIELGEGVGYPVGRFVSCAGCDHARRKLEWIGSAEGRRVTRLGVQ